MRRILSTFLPILFRPKDQQLEDQKISYWLEKLFNQEKNKKVEKVLTELKIKAVRDNNQIFSNTKDIEETSEKKGFDEAKKNYAKKSESDRQIIENMVQNSNQIIMRISSVFPWDLFPSIIIVEAKRITIIHRQLFSSQVHSVEIKDIANVFIETSVLFAQLTVVSNTFAQNQIIISRLWKKDAILVRRIIEGLRMFVKENIDITSYKREELIDKLKKLSTIEIVL